MKQIKRHNAGKAVKADKSAKPKTNGSMPKTPSARYPR